MIAANIKKIAQSLLALRFVRMKSLQAGWLPFDYPWPVGVCIEYPPPMANIYMPISCDRRHDAGVYGRFKRPWALCRVWMD
jgi:hypothetical protein